MNAVDFISVSKSFGQQKVLRDVSFSINEGEFVSILGANGSGKSTLLNLLIGQIKQDMGEIRKVPSATQTSFVSQDYRNTLLPWKTNWQNIALPLLIEHKENGYIIDQVDHLRETFHIDVDLGKYPYQLSGGQQQLLALLRGMVTKPSLLLLDEPFTALDFGIRRDTSAKIMTYWRQAAATIIMVTHDMDEAILMSDKIIVLGNKPSQVVEDVRIDLERPRNVSTLMHPHFAELKTRIIKLLGYE